MSATQSSHVPNSVLTLLAAAAALSVTGLARAADTSADGFITSGDLYQQHLTDSGWAPALSPTNPEHRSVAAGQQYALNLTLACIGNDSLHERGVMHYLGQLENAEFHGSYRPVTVPAAVGPTYGWLAAQTVPQPYQPTRL